jgi:RNA polymerase sigma-70 factor (ECF subfamily)
MTKNTEPTWHEPSDELIQRATSGDRAAVGELLYAATDPLTRFITLKLSASLREATSVEDILQETFAVAFRDIGRFQLTPEGSFRGWLRTIALHRIQDAAKECQRKKRGGGQHRIRTPRTSPDDSVLDLFDALAQEHETPLRQASRNEALRIMQVALAELPDNYRLAIRLRYMEGLSYEDIAIRVETSVGAVQGLLKRAKQKLRDALGNASAFLSSR